jgi:hypothetical protein
VSASVVGEHKRTVGRTVTRRNCGGQMVDVVLLGSVIVIFFAVGFAVGVMVIGAIGLRRGRRRRDANRN